MEQINQVYTKPVRTVNTIQFGEGNFLRAFVDYFFDIANEKGVCDNGVVIVKPIQYGSLDMLRSQNCVYTVILRGVQDGAGVTEKRVITSVDSAIDAYEEYAEFMALTKLPSLRFVVSNTTEAGIVYDENDAYELCPPRSYPGKLTKMLHERFTTFSGDVDKGLIILPVELIEQNGTRLKECVRKLSALWKLPDDFLQWVEQSCLFCNTLVDRIVTGYLKEDTQFLEQSSGYTDNMVVAAEPFGLWVIESDKPETVQRALPLDRAGLPVLFTDNLEPYRTRKVRLLNGAHTAMVLAGYLSGLDTVLDCTQDEDFKLFLKHVLLKEIAPTVKLSTEIVEAFAKSVQERFENPYIKHSLLSIALNSVSKWKSRILPTIKDSLQASGHLPSLLCFSLSALAAFYQVASDDVGKLFGSRNGQQYPILDDEAVIRFFSENQDKSSGALVDALCKRSDFWGEDLSLIPNFVSLVAENLEAIRTHGMRNAVKALLKEETI